MAAKNELLILEEERKKKMAETNRIEVTLQAAIRKGNIRGNGELESLDTYEQQREEGWNDYVSRLITDEDSSEISPARAAAARAAPAARERAAARERGDGAADLGPELTAEEPPLVTAEAVASEVIKDPTPEAGAEAEEAALVPAEPSFQVVNNPTPAPPAQYGGNSIEALRVAAGLNIWPSPLTLCYRVGVVQV